MAIKALMNVGFMKTTHTRYSILKVVLAEVFWYEFIDNTHQKHTTLRGRNKWTNNHISNPNLMSLSISMKLVNQTTLLKTFAKMIGMKLICHKIRQ